MNNQAGKKIGNSTGIFLLSFERELMEDLRYPIGPFQPKSPLTESERKQLIRQIAETPSLLRKAIANLDDAKLDTPYRPGGWTVRQVVHHLPDSHLNSYPFQACSDRTRTHHQTLRTATVGRDA